MAVDAIVGLLQAAAGIGKVAVDLTSATDATKRQGQLMEFQQALIGLNSMVASVQQQNATLLHQKNDLESQLKQMKDWEAEKQRYQLVSPFRGVPVFALKEAMSNGEHAHYLCANCFQNGKRSFLAHAKTKDGGRVTLVCSACRFEGRTEWRGVGADVYAEQVTPAK